LGILSSGRWIFFCFVAGQDRFTGLSRIFYTHAVGAIVVFDIFDRDTFNNAALWKKDIDDKVFFSNGDKIPVILMANKCDVIDNDHQPSITSEQIETFCQQHGFFASFRVSAKLGSNVREACQALINKIVENHHRIQQQNKKNPPPTTEDPQPAASIRLKAQPEPTQNQGCCK